MYLKYLKPFLDFSMSLAGFIFLLPIFLIVLIILLITNDGKVFFLQSRPGLNEKIFQVIKFKTMDDKKDPDGNLLPDSKRLTAFGKFIRKTSIDEIPQLLNVIKGDMSLIGPRPLLPEYLSEYNEVQKRRHIVKPGITGLAQVKGRNQMVFSERLKNDVYYVDNLSFLLDMKIFFWTIKSVIFKSSSVVHGQTVDQVDDIGLSKKLSSNHFKR
jgi:lipopolysaccharide/colanic/teichoic acid biosynthesis glycosyltransferase